MIKLVSKGSWKKTRGWLNKAKQQKSYLNSLRKYGQRGVNALRDNTPILTGVTSYSWYYDITENKEGEFTLTWCNRNLSEDWYNVALYIQLGHATRNGYWVEGIDFINPALAPIFDEIAKEVWEEVNDPAFYTNQKIN